MSREKKNSYTDIHIHREAKDDRQLTIEQKIGRDTPTANSESGAAANSRAQRTRAACDRYYVRRPCFQTREHWDNTAEMRRKLASRLFVPVSFVPCSTTGVVL